MKASLFALACSVVVVAACDPPVPQEQALPDGVEFQSAAVCAESLPSTCNTSGGCDSPCSSPAECDTTNSCYMPLCAGSCCSQKQIANTQTCSGTTCCRSVNGVCACGPPRIGCTPGYDNCKNGLADGCETNFADASTCGTACMNIVNCYDAVAHVDAEAIGCNKPLCTFSGPCQTGWGDCDNNKTNGCETSLFQTAAHCGDCGTPCPTPNHATATCTDGACGFTCLSGFVRCGDTCAQCCGDADCPSPVGNKCQKGTCNSGTCSYGPKNCVKVECYSDPVCDTNDGVCKSANTLSGTECGANSCFDKKGTCSAGVCQGATQLDCSSLNGPCKTGVCDPAAGACAAQAIADGTACTSNDKCLMATTCNGGACQGETMICADPGECRSSSCNPATGVCDVVPLVKGSPCTINNPCRQNEACDGDGTCDGTSLSDGTPCEKTCGTDEAASCQVGACTCTSTLDMAAEQGVDLGSADLTMETGHTKGGCSTNGPPSALEVLVLALVGVGLVRRRRQRA